MPIPDVEVIKKQLQVAKLNEDLDATTFEVEVHPSDSLAKSNAKSFTSYIEVKGQKYCV
jgi:hypothetical protein